MLTSLQPLVSCIMPTANRRQFVPHAIRYFQSQDYPNKELVILDDGVDSVVDLIPDDPQIRYFRLEGQRTLGTKRNQCVEASQGNLIMHWDDDDWMAPYRISYQVEALLKAEAEVCGLQQMFFYDLANNQTWLYSYIQPATPNWLAGGSLLYTRDFWQRGPFPDIQVASDTRFIWSHQLNRATILPDYNFYVAMIHQSNTSSKNCRGAYWSRWPGDLQTLMPADFLFYQNVRTAATQPANKPKLSNSLPTQVLENIRPNALAYEREQRGSFQKMKIGYVLLNFPALSETFIRREILTLCQLGHQVVVYTHYRHRDPLVPEPTEPNLTIRQVSFLYDRAALKQAVHTDNIQHLHSSLMVVAQRATYEVAKALQIPFTLTVYSGYDTFTCHDPNLYRAISADDYCEAVIVEDEFMRNWVCQKLGASPSKVEIIPNSFDLNLYQLPVPRQPRSTITILAIARFVEKKGLLNLVKAFNQLCVQRDNAELWLVGQGPEEDRLHQMADRNSKIKFLGSVPEAITRQLYVQADIFCLPCIQTSEGDADGIPTTILEAMAFELPIVSSTLLSTPCYVRDQHEGFLTQPGDVMAIAASLEKLCASPDVRLTMGKAGRERIAQLCDLKQNVQKLQNIMLKARQQRWQASLAALQYNRSQYTLETERYYTEHRRRAIAYFKLQAGRLLDIGCGQGKIRDHLPSDTEYIGCDPKPDLQSNEAALVAALGENLPFAADSLDSVLLYSVLAHVLDVNKVLAEAARVLKPNGRLYMHETVNDSNPIHLNHLSDTDLRRQVNQYFTNVEWQAEGQQFLLLKAQKPGLKSTIEIIAPKPLVSIAITSYNRARFLPVCINSVLNQIHQPVEVIVVDDGSTDETRHILTAYGDKIRVGYNERNRGIAFSKNRALQMTSETARYVALLDSDDYFHPRFIEKSMNVLENLPEIGLVYADDTLVDVNGYQLVHQPAIEPWHIETWLRTCNLRGDTWLARRELIMQTALHDERLACDVDYDLFYQLLEITTFAHLAEFLVYIRQHSGQTTRNRLELAKCHAANLIKYGYSSEYAYLRAQHHPEWLPAIEEGLELGAKLRAERLAGAA